jgi:hypothetical protein
MRQIAASCTPTTSRMCSISRGRVLGLTDVYEDGVDAFVDQVIPILRKRGTRTSTRGRPCARTSDSPPNTALTPESPVAHPPGQSVSAAMTTQWGFGTHPGKTCARPQAPPVRHCRQPTVLGPWLSLKRVPHRPGVRCPGARQEPDSQNPKTVSLPAQLCAIK